MTTQRPRRPRVNEIGISTRFGHETLWAMVNERLGITPDGARLQRVYKTRPPALIYRLDAQPGLVSVERFLAHPQDIAHVLRVGRDGPLIPPGTWAPIDGDWLNVTPSNWRNVDNPAARLPGSAPATPAEDDNDNDNELF